MQEEIRSGVSKIDSKVDVKLTNSKRNLSRTKSAIKLFCLAPRSFESQDEESSGRKDSRIRQESVLRTKGKEGERRPCV